MKSPHSRYRALFLLYCFFQTTKIFYSPGDDMATPAAQFGEETRPGGGVVFNVKWRRLWKSHGTEKNIIDGLKFYAKKTKTKKYNDSSLQIFFWCWLKFKISSEMRIICDSIFQGQHLIMTKILIFLCKHSSDRYHFNILRIIVIIYHIYIESKLYKLACGKIKVKYIKWIL